MENVHFNNDYDNVLIARDNILDKTILIILNDSNCSKKYTVYANFEREEVKSYITNDMNNLKKLFLSVNQNKLDLIIEAESLITLIL